MTTIPIVNLKGGVAKTTNAVAIAETFAYMRKTVLLIDADHQCTASELLLGDSRLNLCESKRKTLHDLLVSMLNSDFSVEQLDTVVVNHTSNIKDGFENLSVIPCSIRIDDFTTNVAKARKGYKTAKEFNKAFNRHRSALKKMAGSPLRFCHHRLSTFHLIAGKGFTGGFGRVYHSQHSR